MAARDILSQEEIDALLYDDSPMEAPAFPKKMSLNLTSPEQVLLTSCSRAQKGKRISLQVLMEQPISLRINDTLIVEGQLSIQKKELFFIVTSELLNPL